MTRLVLTLARALARAQRRVARAERDVVALTDELDRARRLHADDSRRWAADDGARAVREAEEIVERAAAKRRHPSEGDRDE